jgi:hypothetical protein
MLHVPGAAKEKGMEWQCCCWGQGSAPSQAMLSPTYLPSDVSFLSVVVYPCLVVASLRIEGDAQWKGSARWLHDVSAPKQKQNIMIRSFSVICCCQQSLMFKWARWLSSAAAGPDPWTPNMFFAGSMCCNAMKFEICIVVDQDLLVT